MNLLSLHRHDAGGFDLPLPLDWEVSHDIPDCAVVCAARRSSPQVPPHIAVTVMERDEAEPVGDWAARCRGELVEALGLRVIDVEHTQIAELPAYRTLFHHVHPRFGGVCLEQWAVPARDRCYVISCLAGALDYESVADVFQQVATGLRVKDAR